MKKRLMSAAVLVTMLICIFSVGAAAVQEKVSFTRESLDLFIGQSYQLELSDNSVGVTYSSSDPNIVSVNPGGLISALSLGSSVITASDGKGNEAHCSVNVINGESPTGVRIDKQSISLTEGESFTLNATVIPENVYDNRIYYSSSDESVARVDKNGYIKAVKPGVAVITAESASAAVSGKCIVKVSSKSGRNSFSVDINGTLYSIAGEKKVNMLVGLSNSRESLETTTDSNGKFYFDDIVQGTYTLSVYSNNDSKKTIASGQLTVGSYNMSVTCILNDKELVLLYQDENTSTEKARDFNLEKSTLSIEVGKAYDMSFKVVPSGAALPVISGKSSNADVATVDVDGRITGVSEGTAKIVFTSADGKISKSCQVTVTQANSNTFSWIIILLETIIVFLIVMMFMISYKRFLRQKEKDEGLLSDDE